MVDALIFDLDDTLCPERPFVLARLDAVARHLRERYGPRTDFRAELVRCWEADLRTNVFDTVLARAGLAPDPGVIRELVDLYRGTPVEVEPYPDTVPALEFWSGRLPLGLVTDGYGPTQREKVAALGIGPSFRAIVYTHDLGPEGIKPSEVPFRRVREAIGFAGPAAYVGDHPRLDFPAPKRLGWVTVRIARPGAKFARAEADAAARPDHVVHGLEELPTIPCLAQHLEPGQGG